MSSLIVSRRVKEIMKPLPLIWLIVSIPPRVDYSLQLLTTASIKPHQTSPPEPNWLCPHRLHAFLLHLGFCLCEGFYFYLFIYFFLVFCATACWLVWWMCFYWGSVAYHLLIISFIYIYQTTSMPVQQQHTESNWFLPWFRKYYIKLYNNYLL